MSELQMILFGKPFPLPKFCPMTDEEPEGYHAPRPRRDVISELRAYLAKRGGFVPSPHIARDLDIHTSNVRRAARSLESMGLAVITYRIHANREGVMFVMSASGK